MNFFFPRLNISFTILCSCLNREIEFDFEIFLQIKRETLWTPYNCKLISHSVIKKDDSSNFSRICIYNKRFLQEFETKTVFREKLSSRYKQFKQSNERRLFKIQLNVAPIPRNTQKIVLEWANIFVHRSHGRELIFTRLPPGWF